MSPNFAQLQAMVLPLSRAETWAEAVLEWDLTHVYSIDKREPAEECLCGHSPVREICVMANRLTDRVARVGNVCVNRFMGIHSDRLFRAVKQTVAHPQDPTPCLFMYAVREAKALSFDDRQFLAWYGRAASYRCPPAVLERRAQLNKRIVEDFQARRLVIPMRWLRESKRLTEFLHEGTT